MNERAKKLQELLSNEELAREVFSIEKPEEAQQWFADHGVDLSMDEIMWIGSIMNKIAKGEISQETLDAAAKGEVSDELLEMAAGGVDGETVAGAVIGGILVILTSAAIFAPW